MGSASAPLSLVGCLPCSARGARQTGLAQSGKPLPALPPFCFAARTGRDNGPSPIQKDAACVSLSCAPIWAAGRAPSSRLSRAGRPSPIVFPSQAALRRWESPQTERETSRAGRPYNTHIHVFARRALRRCRCRPPHPREGGPAGTGIPFHRRWKRIPVLARPPTPERPAGSVHANQGVKPLEPPRSAQRRLNVQAHSPPPGPGLQRLAVVPPGAARGGTTGLPQSRKPPLAFRSRARRSGQQAEPRPVDCREPGGRPPVSSRPRRPCTIG